MIAIWIREIIGWCLVALSMILARMVLLYVDNRQVVEAGILVILTLGILRAGISLIRVAAAARIVAREVSLSSK